MPEAWVAAVISQLGALGIFALMVPESACIPVPSELTLMCAGFAVSRGLIGLPLAVAAGTSGNLVGSLIAYAVGRWSLRMRPRGRAARGLARADELLARHGRRAVFLARLMPLARTFISLPAGRAGVRIAPFIVLTVAGSAIWSLAFELAGIVAGTGWSRVGPEVGNALLATALVGIAAAAAVRARRRGIG
jgi:membrane protein DedA with SNARE-associated domain